MGSFRRGGEYLGRVQASTSFDMEEVLPVAFEGGIIGVVRDELGVEYVVRARLEAGGG